MTPSQSSLLDVNVAINLISDAHLDVFDVAYLLSAVSDQAATAKLFKSRFPEKTLVSVAPPGRDYSKHILSYPPETRPIDQMAKGHPINRLRELLPWGEISPAKILAAA